MKLTSEEARKLLETEKQKMIDGLIIVCVLEIVLEELLKH